MRPLRLELSNFLSYREPTMLDFTDLPAVVILGENGAGKTSIVEAMGWALYGEGRGRGPDDFVSDGASACRVVFEFTLGEHGTWKVERQREIGRTGKSYLGLFSLVLPDAGGEWMPAGGDSIAETQAAIERLLGMDFDTWMATSFIGQGKADAFTRLTPAARKELLADVLDLAQYEVLAETAKGRRLEASGEETAATRRLGEITDRLEDEPAARDAHVLALRDRDDAARRAEQAEAQLAEARRTLDGAKEAAVAVARMHERVAELRRGRAEAKVRLEEHLARLLREKDAVRADRDHAKQVLAKLRGSAGLIEDLRTQALGGLAEAQRADEEADRHEQLAAEHAGVGLRAAAEAEQAEQAATTCLERVEVLSRSDAPACFACGQDLPPDRRKALLRALGDEAVAHHQREGERRALAADRSAAEQEHRRAVVAHRADAAQARDYATRAEQAVQQAEADAAHMAEEETRLAGLEERLAEHERVEHRAQDDLLRAAQPSYEEDTLVRDIENSADVEASVATAAADVETADRLAGEGRGRLTAGAAELGRAEEVLASFDRDREEADRLRPRLAEARLLGGRYGLLAEAFGRDGIPALIIENALPEIQAEANLLLERLSDGRLTVHLESLRAKKTGGLKETLDVIVADQEDERPLEELSGGERQCVDLALRVALSRVLAHRAGRRIQTLILDEAFTALDAGRRQRAIEIIHALTEEFPCLLFITHLAEMADAFPVRFEVTKDGSSHVEVVAA